MHRLNQIIEVLLLIVKELLDAFGGGTAREVFLHHDFRNGCQCFALNGSGEFLSLLVAVEDFPVCGNDRGVGVHQGTVEIEQNRRFGSFLFHLFELFVIFIHIMSLKIFL